MPEPNELNSSQIIRKDANKCFLEVQNDYFAVDKVHLFFAKYDVSLQKGSRYTQKVNIYVDIPEFLEFCRRILSGSIHRDMQKLRTDSDKLNKPLYSSMGGTAADDLARYGRSRKDGMSLSRVAKLCAGDKVDYAFIAQSGPGETDAKGLIVPRFGSKPENSVFVGLSWESMNHIALVTQMHIQAFYNLQYMNAGLPILPQPDKIDQSRQAGQSTPTGQETVQQADNPFTHI